VQYIHTRHRRAGTLQDSRYMSSLIQAEDDLLLCQRYTELNPVRATLVNDPAICRWTRHPCNALGRSNPMLTPY